MVLEPTSDGLQDTVTDVVSISIIDLFEIVQIHEYQCQEPALSFRLRKAMFQPIMEQCAVRHARQCVMKGGVATAFCQSLAGLFSFVRRELLLKERNHGVV